LHLLVRKFVFAVQKIHVPAVLPDSHIRSFYAQVFFLHRNGKRLNARRGCGLLGEDAGVYDCNRDGSCKNNGGKNGHGDLRNCACHNRHDNHQERHEDNANPQPETDQTLCPFTHTFTSFRFRG